MDLTSINWAAVGIALSGGIILLLRDWRVTFPALLLNYVFVALLLTQQPYLASSLQIGGWGISAIVLVKLITGVAVTAILTLTALMFSREYGLEDLDEFSLAELRRAARRAQRQGVEPFRFSNYVVAFWALVLAALAALALPRLYPILPSIAVDFSWYWLALTGLFTMVVAGDLLKIGLGLMLCANCIDLLYTAHPHPATARIEPNGLGVYPLGLLSLMAITLALGIAYLSGLLYGRLKTLELNELYKR
jgi:multisubunit Na+/H+ antiporter MnhC subunit